MSPPRPPAPVQTVPGAIVFTDIAGFTEFTAARGDEAALALLALQERLVHEEMDDLGRVVKELGDGLLLWFDDPCRAGAVGRRPGGPRRERRLPDRRAGRARGSAHVRGGRPAHRRWPAGRLLRGGG